MPISNRFEPARRRRGVTTLRELARHLGLSPATVSRALNGFPEVSEKTRARVIEASIRLSYKPNLSAKRLATGKSGMVGIVFQSARERAIDPHFADFLASLSSALADSEIDLVVHISSPVDQLAHYRRFADGGLVDGMILSAPAPRDPRVGLLNARGMPFVVHGRGDDSAAYAYYDIDNAGAFALATQLLIDLGHKRIAFSNGPGHLGFAIQRKTAFLATMAERKLPVPERFIGHDEMTEDVGFAAAARWLSEPARTRPTAFICSSTLQALGVMRAAGQAGLTVGRDVSIISHDDVLPHLRSENFAPPLTVTRAPIRDAGPVLAAMIVERMRGTAVEKLQRTDKVDLIVRASTGAAPSEGGTPWQL
jgi:LacI family transcriptional regulator